MVDVAERDKVGVIVIVVLYEHTLVLETDDRDPIPIVFGERGDPESEG